VDDKTKPNSAHRRVRRRKTSLW